MIDKLKLSLFLKPEYLTFIKSNNQSFLDYQILNLWGFKVSAGSVSYDEIENPYTEEMETKIVDVTNEQHPWESLPSSYSGLALKWWDSNSLTSEPRLEIKGSPAKLMQGHNVFGSTSIRECSYFMIRLVQDRYPHLIDAIDWRKTTLDLIDVTYSAKLEPRYHLDFISFLRNISNGQMRRSVNTNIYDTTCYLTNPNSKHKVLKCYLKYPEMVQDIEALKKAYQKNPFHKKNKLRLDVMTDNKLLEWAKPLLRFEATLKKQWFNHRKYPLYLKAWLALEKQTNAKGENLIQKLWLASFEPMLDALSGEGINMQNKNLVHNKLKAVFFKETKKGLTFTKADRIFSVYMRIINEGYDKVYETMDKNTFGRALKDLKEATGTSKAQLQNLTADEHTNIIPFCELVNIDFSIQIPEWANVA